MKNRQTMPGSSGILQFILASELQSFRGFILGYFIYQPAPKNVDRVHGCGTAI